MSTRKVNIERIQKLFERHREAIERLAESDGPVMNTASGYYPTANPNCEHMSISWGVDHEPHCNECGSIVGWGITAMDPPPLDSKAESVVLYARSDQGEHSWKTHGMDVGTMADLPAWHEVHTRLGEEWYEANKDKIKRLLEEE